MLITDVGWVRDSQSHPMLQLRLDGRLAHISSLQSCELTRRGLVKGIDFLASKWQAEAGRGLIQGVLEPGLKPIDLAGCTDDPQVVALHQEMCRSILDCT